MKMICLRRQDGVGYSTILYLQSPEIKALRLLSTHSNNELKMGGKSRCSITASLQGTLW